MNECKEKTTENTTVSSKVLMSAHKLVLLTLKCLDYGLSSTYELQKKEIFSFSEV